MSQIATNQAARPSYEALQAAAMLARETAQTVATQYPRAYLDRYKMVPRRAGALIAGDVILIKPDDKFGVAVRSVRTSMGGAECWINGIAFSARKKFLTLSRTLAKV